MDTTIARINRLSNGYTVAVCDPEVQAANKDSKKPWRDPWKTYTFKTVKEVNAFLEGTLGKLVPPDDDYGTNFARAVKEK